jgi:hypothetical protein
MATDDVYRNSHGQSMVVVSSLAAVLTVYLVAYRFRNRVARELKGWVQIGGAYVSVKA